MLAAKQATPRSCEGRAMTSSIVENKTLTAVAPTGRVVLLGDLMVVMFAR
jgi:hypothetical protein